MNVLLQSIGVAYQAATVSRMFFIWLEITFPRIAVHQIKLCNGSATMDYIKEISLYRIIVKAC